MKTYIALFRGINVGGKHILPMKELKTVLETLGLQNIQTYIQSGNVVFRSDTKDVSQLACAISAAIKKSYGFAPQVQLLTIEEMEEAISSNPFPQGESEPKTLHLHFLAVIPEKPDLKALENMKTESERFELQGKVFYLHAPDGIGRSKLAGNVERALGVSLTARNWRTVCKIMEMAKEVN